MINIIIQIKKNTLEGTNCRVIEGEQISELEGRMLETTEAVGNLEKKGIKILKTESETSGTMLSTPTFES